MGLANNLGFHLKLVRILSLKIVENSRKRLYDYATLFSGTSQDHQELSRRLIELNWATLSGVLIKNRWKSHLNGSNYEWKSHWIFARKSENKENFTRNNGKGSELKLAAESSCRSNFKLPIWLQIVPNCLNWDQVLMGKCASWVKLAQALMELTPSWALPELKWIQSNVNKPRIHWI